MDVVCISDTHMTKPELPDGDLLIHAGDLTYRGRPSELGQQRRWLSEQMHRYKVIIPGNHDFGFEEDFARYRDEFAIDGITVLNDSGITIEGVKIWGSPISPFFNNWAFNRFRGEQIQYHWDLIPDDTEILITHGPPLGILDDVSGERVGCEDLLDRIKSLNRLKLHIFGHIHDPHGERCAFGIRFVNASVLNDKYEEIFKPICLTL